MSSHPKWWELSFWLLKSWFFGQQHSKIYIEKLIFGQDTHMYRTKTLSYKIQSENISFWTVFYYMLWLSMLKR